jgi:hypothetical protein
MSEPTRLPRLYDEKEVARMLKRATELQREDPVRPNPAEGLSLRELEEIAAEAGIDPQHLRRAALEIDAVRDQPTRWTTLLGENPTVAAGAVVPGELVPEDFELLIPIIQQTMREHGQPSLLGRTLTWRAEVGQKERSIQVVVTSRDGETTLQAEERLQRLAGAIFGGGVAGGGSGIGVGFGLPLALNVLGSPLLAFAFPLGAMALGWMGAREIFRRIVRKRRKVLSELVARLSAEVTRLTAARALAADDDAEARRLPPA